MHLLYMCSHKYEALNANAPVCQVVKAYAFLSLFSLLRLLK